MAARGGTWWGSACHMAAAAARAPKSSAQLDVMPPSVLQFEFYQVLPALVGRCTRFPTEFARASSLRPLPRRIQAL